ncbi:MAG: tyrosinase family protein [Acidobacteria bacterium]|nr:tyrosinase family protein [Acidobacteriota bacterium]
MASLTLRKNVDSLTAQELQTMRTAYKNAQQIMDNRGYNYFAGLHGIPNWYCWHHEHNQHTTVNANLFLPWHRAYLLYFERAIRDQAPPNTKFGLPWWDWTSPRSHTNGVPTAFSTAVVNLQPNPLYRARIVAPTANPPINRMTRRFPGNPAQLPTPASINAILNLTQFNDFTNQLENVHDFIHGWTGGNNGQVGGDMGSVGTAAWDPVFWSHHCNIDRLWYLWQLKHGVNNISPSLLPMVLTPFHLTVKDVLSINALGYEYAVSLIKL